MASPKAIQFEKDLLSHVGNIKSHVLAAIDGEEQSEDRQAIFGAVNDMYERAHRESRSLRKALAFLHTKLEALEQWARDEHSADVQKIYDKAAAERESQR